ncbi:PP2C family protein-serine/threonine phosphatase [Hymenobacter coccineus]|uniref:Serine/threonine protein phosphatase n=1 Tax=Hymenobacter coccineus TaxID=1908235 RepID=A0A1G1TH31_9BACT|nr:PP2C family protein-serine/threonine phosphatase [Hymenobacter coccineus]OGX90184.1 serine/threonine protein phosphatase [Hymenobacter coccineus]
MSNTTSDKRLFLKERELNALLEITQAITQDSTGEAALYKIFQFTLIGQLGVRRLALYVLTDGVYRAEVSFPAVVGPLPEIVLAQCYAAPCIMEGLDLGPGWEGFETVIPVTQAERVLAYVLIGTAQADYADQEAMKFIETLANILLGAVENRRLTRQRMAAAALRREIEIAQDVQRLLFPTHLPNNAAVAVARTYVPHTQIGGDYFDVVEIDADRLLLCIADVSGKGVAAALLMSNFQAGLRTLLRQGADLPVIAYELNHLIFRNAGGEKFITAFLGIYDCRTRHLRFVNAGHNDPILLPDQGPPQFLKTGAVMLGIIEELPRLEVGEVVVPPRSLLFNYTDGLTEVFDAEGNEFGEEGVLRVIAQNRYLPLPRLHETLLREIRAFGGGTDQFADDVTILSCRMK